MEEQADHARLPKLTWDGDFWVAAVKLPSWAGYEVLHGEGGSRRHAKPADGKARLSVASPNSDKAAPPAAAQLAALEHLLSNEAAIANAVARALIDYCPGNAYDGDDDFLWELEEPEELRRLVRLVGVHVLTLVSGEVACVGFEFECGWDAEHGAGVMTHRGRVIASGQADCAFTDWIARQALDRQPG